MPTPLYSFISRSVAIAAIAQNFQRSFYMIRAHSTHCSCYVPFLLFSTLHSSLLTYPHPIFNALQQRVVVSVSVDAWTILTQNEVHHLTFYEFKSNKIHDLRFGFYPGVLHWNSNLVFWFGISSFCLKTNGQRLFIQ